MIFMHGKQNDIHTISSWNFVPALPNKKQKSKWKPNPFQLLKPGIAPYGLKRMKT